jgi:hypothetical protein
MFERKKVLTFGQDEQEMMVRSLYDMRNSALERNIPTEEVEDLILKVIDAPTRKERRRLDRQTR